MKNLNLYADLRRRRQERGSRAFMPVLHLLAVAEL